MEYYHIMFFIFFCIVGGMQITKIPPTGSPPNKRYQTSSAIDKDQNRLIIFGGYDAVLGSIVSSLITFDLNANTWGQIIPESLIPPPNIMGAIVHIRSDRKMLVLFGKTDSGISSGVYTFDLNNYCWKTETLVGDTILGRIYAASTAFVYLNTVYLAIFGGITHNEAENDLYL